MLSLLVKREEIMTASKVADNALTTLLGVMVLKGRMKTQLEDQHERNPFLIEIARCVHLMIHTCNSHPL